MAEALIRVLVTGGRDYTDRAAVARALTHLDALYIHGALPEQIVLVHGGARGADTLAAKEALKLGWQTEEHKADWDRYGDNAGPIRNLLMVRLGAHYCLAFAGGRGTKNCKRLAKAARIHVIDIQEARHG